MQQSRSHVSKLFALLVPSSLGAVIYVFASAITIVLNQFEFIKKYLQVPQSVEVGRAVARLADGALTGSLGESKTTTLVVGLFWAVVGLAVYIFLRAFARFITELDDDLSVRRYVWPKDADRSRPLRIWAEQMLVRLVAVIGLVVVAFGPLAQVVRGPVFTEVFGSGGTLLYIVWFLAIVLVLHLITILLRLLTLRPRLFG